MLFSATTLSQISTHKSMRTHEGTVNTKSVDRVEYGVRIPTLLVGHMPSLKLVSAFVRGLRRGNTAPIMLWDRRPSHCSHLWASLVSGLSLQKLPTRRQRAHSRRRTHDTTNVVVPILGIHAHRDGNLFKSCREDLEIFLATSVYGGVAWWSPVTLG